MTSNLAYHGPLGDAFAAIAEHGAHNAYVDRPAMLELAGDVTGQHIVDLGCGTGSHATGLIERGATVVGLEGSATLTARARARLGDRAEIRQHDLDTPLPFEPESFDGALCALVLHHLRDRRRFLAEVHRVLRPGGWFAISTTHPAADWRFFQDSYFSDEWVDLPTPDGKHTIQFQRMSLETIIGEVLAAGFVLERLVEPRPVEALRAVDPAAYDRLSEKPTFLAIRLRRP